MSTRRVIMSHARVYRYEFRKKIIKISSEQSSRGIKRTQQRQFDVLMNRRWKGNYLKIKTHCAASSSLRRGLIARKIPAARSVSAFGRRERQWAVVHDTYGKRKSVNFSKLNPPYEKTKKKNSSKTFSSSRYTFSGVIGNMFRAVPT